MCRPFWWAQESPPPRATAGLSQPISAASLQRLLPQRPLDDHHHHGKDTDRTQKMPELVRYFQGGIWIFAILLELGMTKIQISHFQGRNSISTFLYAFLSALGSSRSPSAPAATAALSTPLCPVAAAVAF
jgi:hypothetical protein